MNGSPPTFNRDLGKLAVAGRSRVERPPASNARGGSPSLHKGAFICDQLLQRSIHRLAAIHSWLPVERTDSPGIQTHHGYIALPAAISARVFEARLLVQLQAFHGHLSNLRHCHRVIGRHVEHSEACLDLITRSQYRIDYIGDVYVRFALLTVSKDPETVRVGAQSPHEIEADSVRLPRPHHIAETKRASR